jgi:hypothetical protein
VQDDQRIQLGNVVDAYLARCRAAGLPHSARLLETFNELRGDTADSGEVQVPTDIVLSAQGLGDSEAIAVADALALVKCAAGAAAVVEAMVLTAVTAR